MLTGCSWSSLEILSALSCMRCMFFCRRCINNYCTKFLWNRDLLSMVSSFKDSVSSGLCSMEFYRTKEWNMLLHTWVSIAYLKPYHLMGRFTFLPGLCFAHRCLEDVILLWLVDIRLIFLVFFLLLALIIVGDHHLYVTGQFMGFA